MKTIFAIHTGPVLVEVLKPLFAELLPDARLVNITDDGLLTDVRAAGEVTPALRDRLIGYGRIAAQSGADAILNCCSSVGEAADDLAAQVHIPVVKIDDAMTTTALEHGARIAVLATVSTTLDPTERMLRRKATAQSKQLNTTRFLADTAFDALLRGEPATHDALVREAILTAARDHDAVVLAQGSMARLVPLVQPETATPILSSPRSGVLAVRRALESA